MYGLKIRTFRVMRGFSQEDMANRLGIGQNTYSKIEGNKQKITHELLEKISKELGVTIADLTSQEPIIINNHASNHGAQGNIENFYAEQKELYEKLIASKDAEINNLKEIVQSLKEVITTINKK
jgi:transcriptional regulator with XRE-family HTH domain